MPRQAVHVLSAGVVGLEARLVEVEVAPSQGTNHFQVIGLPDSAVRESAHRVLSALVATDFPLPRGPVLVNLAPAATRKQGAALDLALALGVAAVGGTLDGEGLAGSLAVGELSLDGRLRPAGHAFLVGCLARQAGVARVLCPAPEAPEMALAAAPVPVWGVESLLEAALLLLGRRAPPQIRALPPPEAAVQPDLADVRGQLRAQRALLLAAAGGHHMLLVGPPGAGKSFLALRLPGILPPLLPEEQHEVTRIRSALGLPLRGLVRERPFRAPHHTASYAGLVGGGAEPRPGEVTLAHRGVLFLDELPEFERRTLEALRQPLEEGVVRVGRAKGLAVFPARFQLVAAMNPCPCGYQGHPLRPCRCLPKAVAAYQGRVSGPLLDRLDLRVWVPPVAPAELMPPPGTPRPGPTSAWAREQVLAARDRQRHRFRGTGYQLNAELPSPLLDLKAPVTAGARAALLLALERLGLSARGLVRVRRLARTAADLAGAETVGEEHVLEALSFRGEEPRGEGIRP